MHWSVSKLTRIESEDVRISVNDLKALLEYYHVSDPDVIQRLLEMASQARKRSWLNAYKDVASPKYLSYLGFEEAAARSYNFQPVLVPGLLQTEDYASEVMHVIGGSPSRVDGLIELRLTRQERTLARGEDLQLFFLIDESVLHRAVGGPNVMAVQIQRLIEARQLPNVGIEVLPFSIGIYRALRLPYVVLEFPNPDEEALLYLENPHGEALMREDIPEHRDDEGVLPIPPTYLQIFMELRQRTSAAITDSLLAAALERFSV